MVCFRYIIVNNLHKCDNKDDDDDEDNDNDDDDDDDDDNNNNRPRKGILKTFIQRPTALWFRYKKIYCNSSRLKKNNFNTPSKKGRKSTIFRFCTTYSINHYK